MWGGGKREKEERKKERKWMGRVRVVYGDGDSHYD